MTVDEYLDRARLYAALPSDNALATHLGLKRATVSCYRTRRAWPSDETMIALADLARVDRAHALADLNEWRTNSPIAAEIYRKIAAGIAIAVIMFVNGMFNEAKARTSAEHCDVSKYHTIYYATFGCGRYGMFRARQIPDRAAAPPVSPCRNRFLGLPAMTKRPPEAADEAIAATAIERLLEIMTRLRDPAAGCPWDREQDFATIAPYTIEEAYEVADAIQRGDMAALKDELGDLLFQVVFHAEMARERGAFDFAAVAERIADKMLRRHPHVFGDTEVKSAAAQTKAWEAHKAAERAANAATEGRPHGALDGVALGLPALMRADKLQRRAARVGFDWPEAAQVIDKIEEEIGELRHEVNTGAVPDRVEDEIGDLLFAIANLARHLAVDPEAALRRTNAKFESRFRRIEALLAADGRTPADASLDEMEALWQQAKREERGG